MVVNLNDCQAKKKTDKNNMTIVKTILINRLWHCLHNKLHAPEGKSHFSSHVLRGLNEWAPSAGGRLYYFLPSFKMQFEPTERASVKRCQIRNDNDEGMELMDSTIKIHISGLK